MSSAKTRSAWKLTFDIFQDNMHCSNEQVETAISVRQPVPISVSPVSIYVYIMIAASVAPEMLSLRMIGTFQLFFLDGLFAI